MNIICLDFETYFDDEFTLSKMTTEAYIRDPRFEVHGCAFHAAGDAGGCWAEGEYLTQLMRDIDWTKTAALCHHAHFDGLILSHHFGVKPAAWLDTLSMARLLLGNHLKKSLAALAKHFDLQDKNVPYDLFRGKHWHEISEEHKRLIGEGACHDVELTLQIFNLLAKDFPASEYPIVDTTVRMFTEPVLEGDMEIFGEVWTSEQARKAAAFEQIGASAKEIGSNATFIALLEAEGVEIEHKSGKNGPIPAFAKTDQFMRDLLDSDNDRVAMLAAARLGQRSTIEQSRAERLGDMAMRGPMCVYLNYCGADTTRWSGGDSVNWQNNKRGSRIRKAIKAPPGHKLVIADASQIECRMLNTFAGQWDVVEKFRRGDDIYSELATQFYGFPVDKSKPAERGTGKQLELSCGYGAGDATIVRTAKAGTYGPPVELTLGEGGRAKDLYRGTHQQVVELWREAGTTLSRLAGRLDVQWGCVQVRGGKIWLPNGTALDYTSLEWHHAEDGNAFWRRRKRSGWTKMYGAKLVENLIQALARVFVSDIMLQLRVQRRRIVMCTHDDLVCCVPEAEAEQTLKMLEYLFCLPPQWMPEIPLKCEALISDTYEK